MRRTAAAASKSSCTTHPAAYIYLYLIMPKFCTNAAAKGASCNLSVRNVKVDFVYSAHACVFSAVKTGLQKQIFVRFLYFSCD